MIENSEKAGNSLLSDVKFFEDRFVALCVFLFQEIQESAALADHLQKAATGMMILGVGLEVFGQVIDPLC